MADPMFDQAVIDAYVGAGWWGTVTLGDVVAGHAASRPTAPPTSSWTARRPVRFLGAVRRALVAAGVVVRPAGLEPGDRLGVVLPDGATVHTVFLAAEKAGLVVVGIGARAGEREVRYLLAGPGRRPS